MMATPEYPAGGSTSSSAGHWYQPPYQSTYQPSCQGYYYQGQYQTPYQGYYSAAPYDYGYNWYSAHPGAQYPVPTTSGYPATIKQEMHTPPAPTEQLSPVEAFKPECATTSHTKVADTSLTDNEPAAKSSGSRVRKRPLQPGKPPYSQIALICMAIQDFEKDGTKGATLKQMFFYIEHRFPFYRQSKKWYSSIRHTLSINDCFTKLPHRLGSGDKGCPWALAEGFEDMFNQGSLLRRGYRYKVGSAKWDKVQSKKSRAADPVVGPDTSTPKDATSPQTHFFFPQVSATPATNQCNILGSLPAQTSLAFADEFAASRHKMINQQRVQIPTMFNFSAPVSQNGRTSPAYAPNLHTEAKPIREMPDDCSFVVDIDSLDMSMYEPLSPLPNDSGYEGKAEHSFDKSHHDLMDEAADCSKYNTYNKSFIDILN